MITITPAWLKAIELLKNVPDDQLQWWIDQSRHYVVPEGETLFKEDEPIVGTHVIVTGNIHFFYWQNGAKREISDNAPHTITGYLPYSRGLVAGGTGVATADSQIMTFPIERMPELIRTHFELTQALVHVMTTRVRDYTTYAQQHEKMMSLGKLSAGLAHELNNPAAAIVRSSTLLKSHLRMQPETFKKVISVRMTNEQVDAVNQQLFDIMSRKDLPQLTLMQRSEKEDDFTDWLEDHEVENAPELAEMFVDFGFTPADLDFFAGQIAIPHLSPVLNWINNNLVTEKMVTEIQEASQRISDLVGSVKNFTHMDRAQDKQYCDIRNGIRNTLTMLNHKLKHGHIKVIETFDESLPHVNAFIGELNQVWTNLIDNAIDAMEDVQDRVLEIKTEKDKEFVKVTIIDNGPGIPAEVKDNIFDPFFTTKAIDKGTGLGLDVVSRIVKQHHGSIKVDSVAGRTQFIVCFPING